MNPGYLRPGSVNFKNCQDNLISIFWIIWIATIIAQYSSVISVLPSASINCYIIL